MDPEVRARMRRPSQTKWFRLRVLFALGVLALLGVELSGRRNRPVVVAQAVLIAGIIVTSALDLRDLRHKPDQGLDERVEL
jgi:hypothetical protein